MDSIELSVPARTRIKDSAMSGKPTVAAPPDKLVSEVRLVKLVRLVRLVKLVKLVRLVSDAIFDSPFFARREVIQACRLL